MPPELQGPYVPAAIIFVVSSFFTLNAVWDLIDGVRSYEWPSVEGRIIDHAVSLGASKYTVDDALVFAYAYASTMTRSGRTVRYSSRASERGRWCPRCWADSSSCSPAA